MKGSKFYKIVLTVEWSPESQQSDEPYLIGRAVEKAIDRNTDMIAWILSVDPTSDRSGL